MAALRPHPEPPGILLIMKGIVYKATNTLNGKVYVGQTVRDLKTRSGQHIRCARRGAFGPFYDAIRLYGPDAFSWEIIETIEIEGGADTIARYNIKPALNAAEQKHIKANKSYNPAFGYNIAGAPAKGRPRKYEQHPPVVVFGVEDKEFVGEFPSLVEARGLLGIDAVHKKIIRRYDTLDKLIILPRVKYIAFDPKIEELIPEYLDVQVLVRKDQRRRENKTPKD